MKGGSASGARGGKAAGGKQAGRRRARGEPHARGSRGTRRQREASEAAGDAAKEWEERTASDLSGLLVELGRVVKSLGFYGPGHPERREVLDRAHLAWQIDLDRAGPLEVWVEAWGFGCTGVRESIGRGELEDLSNALLARGVERVRFERELGRASFQGFTELLAVPIEELDARGGFAEALFADGVRGIAVNGQEAPLCPAAAIEAGTAPPPASLGSSLLGSTSSFAAAGEARPEAGASAPAEPEGPQLAEVRARELSLALRELEDCDDDARYAGIARHAAGLVARLRDAGRPDEAYRVLCVLADHAAGRSGRSAAQALTAQDTLLALADDAAMLQVIERAAGEGSAVVRASQVLLQLGPRAVDPLLERILTELHPGRRAQLGALAIALGDCAVEGVARRMRSGPDGSRLVAIQLAGSMQHPGLLPAFLRALCDGRAALRREAARALVGFGSKAAVDALAEALDSPVEEVVENAAHHLGQLRDGRALKPLVAALEGALARRRYGTARRLVHALGQLAAPEATRGLASVLAQKTWLRQRTLVELQLEAIAALEQIPGSEARRVLARATRSRYQRVAARAATALSERLGS